MNPDGAETCQKCEASLTSSTYTPPVPQASTLEEQDEKKTMVVQRSAPSEASKSVKLHCPNCGYPVWSNMSICPQCKYPLDHSDSTDGNDIKPEEPTPTPPQQSDDADDSLKKTINPFLSPRAEEKPLSGPRITLSSNNISENGKEPQSRVLHGKEIRLNAEGETTQDPQETQTVITLEEGQWYIEDKGEVKSTLVLASRKMPIQTGDIFIINDHQCMIVDTDNDE